MATLQIRIDDNLKHDSDTLFAGLGLDTPTAVRIFLTAALEYDGFPFPIKHRSMSNETIEAIEDARNHRNLHGPYLTAEEAVAAMLED
jgi:DNA-damage-inducible protein J